MPASAKPLLARRIKFPVKPRPPHLQHSYLATAWVLLFCFGEDRVQSLWAQEADRLGIQDTDSARQSGNPPGKDTDSSSVPLLNLQNERREDLVENELKEVLAKAPRQDKAVRRLALFYIERSRYDEAIQVIAEHVKVCGVTALGYELEAELLFNQKLYDSALEAAVASMKLETENARIHQLLGLIHIAKRQDAAAVVELQKAAELDPGQPDTRYFLGRVLYSSGNYGSARDQFLACLKLEPGYRKALENLGLCYDALQEHLQATEAYQKAISLEEGQKGARHAEPYAYYGAMLARLGESEKALAVLRRGIELSPKSFVANYHLGRILLNLGDTDEAERFLLAAASLDPTFSRTYYLLGNLRKKQNRKEDAARYQAKFQDLDRRPENRIFPLTDR
jgi:tetratricopeptide (TPR) repeat protein